MKDQSEMFRLMTEEPEMIRPMGSQHKMDRPMRGSNLLDGRVGLDAKACGGRLPDVGVLVAGQLLQRRHDQLPRAQ